VELSSSRQEMIRTQFEMYCKSIIRNTKKNYMRDMQRLAEHEITFSDLSERKMNRLQATCDYRRCTLRFHYE
jgi:hypothetical protein